MKTKLTIFITLIASFFLFAEDLITWSKTYTGEWEFEDQAYDVEQTSDGGYIVIGEKEEMTLGGPDVHVLHTWIVKLNESGDTTWTRTYFYNIQNSTPWDEYYHSNSSSYDIEETSDGGYIFCGSVNGSFTDWERCMSIVKLDKNGSIEWDKTYLEGKYNYAYSIKETSDGNYIVGGIIGLKSDSIYHDTTAKIMKIDNIGDTLWTRNYQYSEVYPPLNKKITWLNKICINSSKEIFGVGYVYEDESINGWLVKIDENGNTIWSNVYGGLENDVFQDIQITIDENLILLGSQFLKNVDAEGIWLYKINMDGDSIWTNTIHSGVYDNRDLGRSIQQTLDGGYIIGAETEQIDYLENDWWIIKTDAYGDTIWSRIYGSDYYDFLNSIKQTSDGGYIICGNTEGEYLVNGNNDYTDYWVLKLDQDGNYTGIMHNGELIIENYELEQNYPNPFNNQTSIEYAIQDISEVELSIYNSNGQLIQNLINEKQSKGKHQVFFKADNLNSGIYYYRLKVDGIVKETRKMLYLR
ncbi:MAG: T9SS type A sorting domain-containing protein [Candidatus Delongbacteria bacterium]|jgi:hypothetical protein|nr:T9SS type A sorting domain-containing protein [Candidatus Delongbacteria bacterium]